MKSIVQGLRLLASLFVFVLLCYSLQAQDKTGGAIKGSVRTADGKPAENINILLKGTRKTAITDVTGNFEIKHVPAGSYELEAVAVGLTTVSIKAVVTGDGVLELPALVLAESEVQLEQVVVSTAAAKFAKKQSDYVARMPLANLENPQVYTVVPKELLQEQVVVDFMSALQAAPGVNNITLGLGSGGVGLAMRMRGFSGANAAGAIRNGMSTNWVSLSDPVNLERIEVIKGPSATLFGSTLTTYGGLVNRITKKPGELTKGEISYSGGSRGLSRLTGDFNTALNKEKTMLFRVNGAYHREKSFQDFGLAKSTVLAPSFTYLVNDRLTLDFDFEFYNSKRNATYVGFASTTNAKSFDDLNWNFKYSYTTDELLSEARIFNAYAKATYKLSDSWSSQTAYSYASTDNAANYLFLLINPTADSVSRRIMNIPSNFGISQFQQNFVGDFKIGQVRNRLLIGLDYVDLTSSDRRATVNPFDKVKLNETGANISMAKYQQVLAGLNYSQYRRHLQTYSAYVSDVVNITDRLLAMASLRIDYYDNEFDDYDQTAASPKLGIVYQVVKDKVSVFGNYMNGFTNVAPGTTSADPTNKTDFKPEHANQLEGGVKLELLKGKLSGTLSYYDIKVDDKVRPDPTNPTYSLQDGTQSSKGFEADVIANPFPGMHMIFGYGYNESKYTKAAAAIDGKRPYSTPANVANVWISYKFMQGAVRGLGLGCGGNTVSDSYLNDANSFTVPGYTKFDATVFYEQSKYRLALKLNNVTNEQYWTADFWAAPQPKRQFIVNMTYKF